MRVPFLEVFIVISFLPGFCMKLPNTVADYNIPLQLQAFISRFLLWKLKNAYHILSQ